jgi:hypothetical protein
MDSSKFRIRCLYVLAAVGLYLALLTSFDSDRSVFVVFLSLVGTCSMLAGRDLARAVPRRIGVVGSLLAWAGVAALYATGIIRREPGYSQYLVYLALLSVGYVLPLSVLVEIFRSRRKRAGQVIMDARDQGAQKP